MAAPPPRPEHYSYNRETAESYSRSVGGEAGASGWAGAGLSSVPCASKALWQRRPRLLQPRQLSSRACTPWAGLHRPGIIGSIQAACSLQQGESRGQTGGRRQAAASCGGDSQPPAVLPSPTLPLLLTAPAAPAGSGSADDEKSAYGFGATALAHAGEVAGAAAVRGAVPPALPAPLLHPQARLSRLEATDAWPLLLHALPYLPVRCTAAVYRSLPAPRPAFPSLQPWPSRCSSSPARPPVSCWAAPPCPPTPSTTA